MEGQLPVPTTPEPSIPPSSPLSPISEPSPPALAPSTCYTCATVASHHLQFLHELQPTTHRRPTHPTPRLACPTSFTLSTDSSSDDQCAYSHSKPAPNMSNTTSAATVEPTSGKAVMHYLCVKCGELSMKVVWRAGMAMV